MAPLVFAFLAKALDPPDTPLSAWPMIMSHDAATAYLEGGALHPANLSLERLQGLAERVVQA